jgi:hypothetical protein
MVELVRVGQVEEIFNLPRLCLLPAVRSYSHSLRPPRFRDVVGEVNAHEPDLPGLLVATGLCEGRGGWIALEADEQSRGRCGRFFGRM